MGDSAAWGARDAAVVWHGFTQIACDVDIGRVSSELDAPRRSRVVAARPERLVLVTGTGAQVGKT